MEQEVASINCQQYGHLNNICIMTTVHMPMWIREMPKGNKPRRRVTSNKVMTAERGKISLLRSK